MIYVLEDQGSRDYMEDRHYIEKKFFFNYDLYCVFDGHGNNNIAKFLHLYFKDILRNELFLSEDHSSSGISKAIYSAFQKTNVIIPHEMGMMAGSTALVVLQNKEEAFVANTGDCRAVMNNHRETLQLSIDHKPNLPSELERIEKAGGFVSVDPHGTPRVNGNLALSRAFGDFYLSPSVIVNPDIYYYKLTKANNFIVIASDGVYDTVQNHEIIDSLLKKHDHRHHIDSIRIACHDILELSRKRGSGDNITIIVSEI
jgi:serine/threonine protein phosphatase PrpC